MYNDVREEAAAMVGVFFKEGVPFSFGDNLISVSGHMMRMALLYAEGRCSFWRWLCKVNSNIHSVLKRRGASKSEMLDESSFSEYLHVRPRVLGSAERAEKNLWHTKDEWVSGFIAASKFYSSLPYEIGLIKELVIFFPSLEDRIGEEVYEFRQKQTHEHSSVYKKSSQE